MSYRASSASRRSSFQTNENVGSGELDLPEQQMHTTAYWLEIPLSIVNVLPYASDDRRDGVVGLAFAMKQVAQLLLMCDARDVGLSVNAGETDGDDTPRIFLYDAYPAASASARRSGACSPSCCRRRARSLPVAIATAAARCASVRSVRPARSRRPWRCGSFNILLAPTIEAAAEAVALQTNEEVPF